MDLEIFTSMAKEDYVHFNQVHHTDLRGDVILIRIHMYWGAWVA